MRWDADDIEARALAGLTLNPHAAAHQLGQAPADRQAQAGAAVLARGALLGLTEGLEQLRLTLGGNLAGLLPYREAALPLLLADATVLTVAPGADDRPPVRLERPLRAIFDKRLVLAPGELVLSFAVPLEAPEWPWSHYRRTRTGEVDYPLATVAMVHDGAGVRFAVSGAHPYPFRSDAVDARLSKDGAAALPAVLEALGPLRADARASLEYREALLQNMIRAGLEDLA